MNIRYEVAEHAKAKQTFAKAKQKYAKAHHYLEKTNETKVQIQIVYRNKSCSTFKNVSSTFTHLFSKN